MYLLNVKIILISKPILSNPAYKVVKTQLWPMMHSQIEDLILDYPYH